MKILLTETEIAERVAQLGREITEAYRGRELTVITVMNGAVVFAADLLRKIDLPLQLDSFAASSYENDRSSGKITIRSALKLPVRGRHVLLVDDIYTTGSTVDALAALLKQAGAEEVCFVAVAIGNTG